MKKLTLKKMQEIIEECHAHIVEPAIVRTKEEARAMNRAEKKWKRLGLAVTKWKIGSQYYVLMIPDFGKPTRPNPFGLTPSYLK